MENPILFHWRCQTFLITQTPTGITNSHPLYGKLHIQQLWGQLDIEMTKCYLRPAETYCTETVFSFLMLAVFSCHLSYRLRGKGLHSWNSCNSWICKISTISLLLPDHSMHIENLPPAPNAHFLSSYSFMNEEELAFSITARGLNSLNYLAELRKVIRKLQRLISFPSIFSLPFFLNMPITYRFLKRNCIRQTK